MIEIVCWVIRAEDVGRRLDRTESDGALRVLEIHQARFLLQSDGAPKGGRTLRDLLATPGRRCLVLIEDVPGELGSLVKEPAIPGAADPRAPESGEDPAPPPRSWREGPPLL